MTRVYLADAIPDERSALRFLLDDLKMHVVGEGADWDTLLMEVPSKDIDILVVDWNLFPASPTAAFAKLRNACPSVLVVVLISHMDAREQAAISAGADGCISKGETPDCVAQHLLNVAASIPLNDDDWLMRRL